MARNGILGVGCGTLYALYCIMPAILNGPYGRHVLKSGYTVLGRDPDCDIQLKDPRLSRHHARFFWHDGMLKIEDLNSQNGILLNGEVVLGSTNVFHGNLVAIGPAVFDISIDDVLITEQREKSTNIEKTQSEQFLAGMDTEDMDSESGSDGLTLPQTSIHAQKQDPSSKMALTQRRSSDANDHQPDPRFADTIADSNQQHSTSQQFMPSTSAAERVATAPALQANGQTTINYEETEPLPNTSPAGEETKSETAVSRQNAETSKIDALLPGTEHRHSGLRISSAHKAFGLLRCTAVILELFSNVLCTVLIAFPILCAGYTIALLECQASMYNDLPTLDYQSSSADWQSIAWSLTEKAGWERAYQLSVEIYEIFPDAFIWIFSSITLATLCVTLYLLISLVAATTIKGAPLWYRVCGLCILEHETGFYPTPLRCCLRWFFAILLAPVAIITTLFNRRGLHDLISGCCVKSNNDHH